MEELLTLLNEIRPEVDFTQPDLAEDGILDSMDIMLIVDGLSQHYNIQFDPMDIIPENFDNIDAIYELVAKMTGAN